MIRNQLDSRLNVTSIAYHQLPTQITIRTKTVNFGAHFCLNKIPRAAIISVIPLPRIHNDSFPRNGGIKASKTPGFTKWTVPLKRNMKIIIFEPIGRDIASILLT
jgi:hypothetical protein